MAAAQGHNYKIENGNFFQTKNWRLCKNRGNSNSGRSLSDVPFVTSIQNCLCALYFCPIIYEVQIILRPGLTVWLTGRQNPSDFHHHWRELPQVSLFSRQTRLLSQQKYACHDKTDLSRQNYVCRSKIYLSRQAYFCRDKRGVLSQQTRVCRDKSKFSATKVLARHIYVCQDKYLSR